MTRTANNLHDTATLKEVGYGAVEASSRTPPPGRMASGYYQCLYGYRVVRPRGAGSWLLFYNSGGHGFFQQSGRRLIVNPGDVCVLAPDAYSDYGVPPGASRKPRASHNAIRPLHAQHTKRVRDASGTWRFHWVHFQAPQSWLHWLAWPDTEQGLGYAHIDRKDVRQAIERGFTRLHADLLAGGPLSESLATTALAEILMRIALDVGSVGRVLDQRVATALAEIQANPAAAHDVASLAQIAKLSPSRFAHLYKEQLGESVMQTVARLRVEHAQRLLSMTDEPVGHIARALGYSSVYYFSRQFSQLVGQSPRAYRNTMNRAAQ